jgi:hypothetical protein
MYTALGLTAPDRGRRAGAGRQGAEGEDASLSAAEEGATLAAAPAKTPPPAAVADPGGNGPGGLRRGGGNGAAPDTAPADGRSGAGGGGRGRLAERRQNMSPEQRQELVQRMRERGFDPASSAAGGRGGGSGTNGATPSPTPPAVAPGRSLPAVARAGGATTIDALFGPLPVVETIGRVWRHTDKQLEPVRLRLGITDGQTTEVINGNVTEGEPVVTNIPVGGATRPAAAGGFPFGQPGRGGFPGGGFPGGGNRGGNPGGGR